MTSRRPVLSSSNAPVAHSGRARRAAVLFGALAVLAAACGGSGDSSAERTPEAPATAEVPASATAAPAVTEPVAPAPTEAPATTAAPVPSTEPTTTVPAAAEGFAGQVMPLLQENCASCHTGDGPGSAHLPMNVAGDLPANGQLIADAVAFKAMPPWPAGDGDVKFHGDRRLSDEQIKTLVDWVAADTPLDVPADTPIVPTRDAAPPIPRDAVMTGKPYKGSLALIDDYRCQIYDPGLTKTSYLQGLAIEPDQTQVVHHGLIFSVNGEFKADAEAADAATPEVGFHCAGLPNIGGRNDTRLLQSWAPGQAPTIFPADTGVEMGAGDFFIMQIHYHYSDETADVPADESSLVVDFADDAVIAAAGGKIEPLGLALYLGPAEIPCSTQQSGPLCDRNAAIEALRAQNNSLAGFVADSLMLQCGAQLADFAGMTDGTASSSCDLPVGETGKIVSVWGHEHEIGATFRMTLNPGTPEEKVLLDIPRWSFEWQLNYFPIEEIVLEAGDTIRVECSWDRGRNKIGAEPRYIMWSEGTNDEMCYSQIITRPA